jgi:hypothetical protein
MDSIIDSDIDTDIEDDEPNKSTPQHAETKIYLQRTLVKDDLGISTSLAYDENVLEDGRACRGALHRCDLCNREKKMVLISEKNHIIRLRRNSDCSIRQLKDSFRHVICVDCIQEQMYLIGNMKK